MSTDEADDRPRAQSPDEEDPSADESPEEPPDDEPSEPSPTPAVDASQAVRFGLIVYGITAIGLFLTAFLGLTFAHDESLSAAFVAADITEDEELYEAALTAYRLLIWSGPLIAVAVAYTYYASDRVHNRSHLFGAIAAVAGSTLGLVLLVLLLLLFQPDPVAGIPEPIFADISLGDEIPGIVAIVIGSTLSAAIAGYLFDNSRI